jgi:hypothetical protein
MKIRQIKEAVDWEKTMEHNNGNIDRLARLRTQVNIDPVMEEVIDETEKADKNAKEVFTKLSKDADGITPENPGTGKKIVRKPYTEKLVLDESLFNESWTSFGGSWRNQTVKKVNYTEEDISDIAEELMNWYGECFEGWEAADIKNALYGLDGERIPDSGCPIVFTMEEDEDDELDWDEDEYDESLKEDYDVLRDMSPKGLYQFLGRLKSDCDYYLGYGGKAKKHLWANDEKEQIDLMRKVYDKLIKNGMAPTFISTNDINEYEKKMVGINEDFSDRPIATMGLTNTSGIGIYDLNDEEVTYAFIDGGDKEPVKQTATVEYDCEDEEDCRPYFSVGDTKYFLDDFMRITESKSSNLKKKSLDEAKDPDEIEEGETVLDFVDSRLFGTNKRGSKPSSSNYKKTYNFLDNIQIPIKGGKGFSGSFFYPDSNSGYFVDSEGSGTRGKLGRRYPMFDDGIGVYLVDKDEEVLAKAIANELNFNYKLTPISSNKGFNYVAKIFIPESIMEMPIEEYLDSIGKSLKSYKKGTGKRGRKAKVSQE